LDVLVPMSWEVLLHRHRNQIHICFGLYMTIYWRSKMGWPPSHQCRSVL